MSNILICLHPLLFSVLIAAMPYAQYSGFIPPAQFVLPFLSICAFVLFAYFMIKAVTKTAEKTVAVLSPLLMVFFNYGAFYEFISSLIGNAKLKGFILILATILILAALFVYVLKVLRAHKATIGNANKLFCLIAAAMLLFSAISIWAHYRGTVRMNGLSDKTIVTLQKKTTPFPDIYFIVLDEYASPSQMKNYFHSDISSFVVYLKQKGFMVTELVTKSLSTNEIIAGRMNMAIANSANAATAYSSFSESIMESVNLREYRSENQMFEIRNSDVVSFLKNIGYHFVNIGSWFSYTRYNWQADENFNTYGLQFSNEIASIIANNSALRLVFINRYFHKTAVLDAFDLLGRMPAIAGKPKFVFAHIICPHPPYIFGPSGGKLGLSLYGASKNARQPYIDQHAFITEKVKEFVAHKLSGTKTAPVIIIQSDHGARIKGPGAYQVFSAIYLPSHGSKPLQSSMLSANTFRSVFNEIFGANLEILR